jgi:hypothetical protein
MASIGRDTGGDEARNCRRIERCVPGALKGARLGLRPAGPGKAVPRREPDASLEVPITERLTLYPSAIRVSSPLLAG